MKTIGEVSRLFGVSVRTLQYYDQIGLLRPDQVSDSGYRLYGENALERLQNILLFKALDFSLKDIKKIMDHSDFDRTLALEQQINMLKLKKEQINNCIVLAEQLRRKGTGRIKMNNTINMETMRQYAEEAKSKWGETAAYQEYEFKRKKISSGENMIVNDGLMMFFEEFGKMKTNSITDEKVQKQVKDLQDYITKHYYTCTPQILAGLGQMYVGDERMKANIDAVGGEGTAEFVAQAITVYCKER